MDKLIGLSAADSEKQLQEDIIKAIKALDTPQERFQAVALSHYYEQKKLLDKELEKKIRELTQEYDIKSRPLLLKQNEIISGRAISTEELSLAKDYLTEEDIKETDKIITSTTPIKEYWLRAMLNNDILVEEIKEKDEDALKHLTKLEYETEEGSNNFTLKFHFSENEFFTNQILTKKFEISEDDEVTKTQGTEIQWKEGKNLTVKIVKKTQKNKKTNAKRTVTKEVQDESFFNFFKDGEACTAKDHGDDEECEDEEGQKMQIDQDIGRTLVEEIIPYSVEYFLGVKEPEGDDYGEEGIDEEDMEDEEDEEEEKPKNKKKDKKAHKKSTDSTGSNKKGSDSGKGGDKPAGEKPECKQQ